MILKNEGATVRRAIESALPVVNQVVVGIDSATTDDTQEQVGIALHGYAGKKDVYTYTWKNDFAQARNEALERVTQPHAFILDGHEWLYNGHEKLMEVMEDPSGFDAFQLMLNMCDNPEGRVTHKLAQERILKSYLRYKNAVHNQVDIPDNAQVARLVDVNIYHQQIATAEEREKQRLSMNIPDMLRRWEKERDHKLLPVIGKTYAFQGDNKQAVKFYRMYLERALPDEVDGKYHTYLKLAKALLDSGKKLEACGALMECFYLPTARNEHLTFLADIHLGMGDNFRAIYYAALATNIPEPPDVAILFIRSYREDPWEIMRRAFLKIGDRKSVYEIDKIIKHIERATA